MNYLKFKTLALLLLCFNFLGLEAQDALLSAGVSTSGSDGSMSYSVGQVVYTTQSGTNGSAMQGVQQAYVISEEEETNLNQSLDIELNYSVYPNPTTDFLTLSVEGTDNSITNCRLLLFDASGKVLQNHQLKATDTRISMTGLPASCYYLKIIKDGEDLKTFKIIKNQ